MAHEQQLGVRLAEPGATSADARSSSTAYACSASSTSSTALATTAWASSIASASARSGAAAPPRRTNRLEHRRDLVQPGAEGVAGRPVPGGPSRSRASTPASADSREPCRRAGRPAAAPHPGARAAVAGRSPRPPDSDRDTPASVST